MATRAEIRDAFYSELSNLAGSYDVTDASGNVIRTITLDSDHIALLDQESLEQHPSILYTDSYNRVTYNGVGAAPEKVVITSGTVDEEIWKEYVEAQFSVYVRAADDLNKEPIYEALRTVFQTYRMGFSDESNFHPDVRRIEVTDANTVDTSDSEQTIRGDELIVFIEFHREYSLTEDNIETIGQTVDADTSSGGGITYSTT